MKGLTPEEKRGLLLSVGRSRGKRAFSPLEVARALKKALQAGSTPEELARALQLSSTTMISRFLRLLELEQDEQYLVDWGDSPATLSFSAASEIVRLKNDADRLILFRAALEHSMNAAEVKQVIELTRKSLAAVPSAVELVLKQRKRVSVHHVLAGLITDESLQQRRSGLLQTDRDALFTRVVTEDLGAFHIDAWRLGSNQFMLTGSDAMMQAFRASGRDFEEIITASVANRSQQ